MKKNKAWEIMIYVIGGMLKWICIIAFVVVYSIWKIIIEIAKKS